MICVERFVYESDFGNQSGTVEDIFLTNNGVVTWAYLDASQDLESDYEEVLFKMANYGFVDKYSGKECLYGVRVIAEFFYDELSRIDAINFYRDRCRKKYVENGLLSYEFHVVEK